MTDAPRTATSRLRSVDALASKALFLMAARRSEGIAANRARHLRDLFEAAIASDETQVGSVIRDMLRLGISAEIVTDLYIAEVARRLGAAWETDRLSFAEVTIGTARLQSIVRELATAPDAGKGATARIAVVVPRDEDHTLGAVILTGQLRRVGLGVSLHMGDSHENIAAALDVCRPAAVMISASQSERLDGVEDLVSTVRQVLGPAVPNIVGGPVAEAPDIDVQRMTGADHVATDIHTALASCQLSAVSPMRRRAPGNPACGPSVGLHQAAARK